MNGSTPRPFISFLDTRATLPTMGNPPKSSQSQFCYPKSTPSPSCPAATTASPLCGSAAGAGLGSLTADFLEPWAMRFEFGSSGSLRFVSGKTQEFPLSSYLQGLRLGALRASLPTVRGKLKLVGAGQRPVHHVHWEAKTQIWFPKLQAGHMQNRINRGDWELQTYSNKH